MTIRLLATLALCLAGGGAHAATCTAGATGLAFGAYVSNSASDVPGSGSVTVDCADDGSGTAVSYSIALSAGTSNDYAARTMSGPGGDLGYNLYPTPGLTEVWGDGTGATATVNGSFPPPGTGMASHVAHGRIPANQSLAPGSYGDQLIVTVSY